MKHEFLLPVKEEPARLRGQAGSTRVCEGEVVGCINVLTTPGFVLNFICFKHKFNRTSTDPALKEEGGEISWFIVYFGLQNLYRTVSLSQTPK